ncbi:hypothetical protein D2S45_04815 [Prevotella intermedia]|uniref:Uncharacterized protein n=1 Tax=Prevotella intermedia TaxID=28131 RepID=A0A3R8HT49_PREIN|nr:hypothetical protein D2S53_04575 [Prevotella intermedia]RRF87642.1 hypothetical protein D2S45_04815 [Prevotella intermedia]
MSSGSKAEEERYKCVNIFHKRIYRITILLSTHCKTYCFTFQKSRFCKVKAALLRCKTYAFATSNRNYRFSSELSLQNQGDFHVLYSKISNSSRKSMFPINPFLSIPSIKHL